ncbi:hypothetical protein ACAW74_08960 [Fibrella sp. WM1]|uniref:DUF6934 family protein n=1 Tax=Fibrella musci TaxID=3242485 RepID=UPI003520714D
MKPVFPVAPSLDGRQFDFYILNTSKQPAFVHKRVLFDKPILGLTNMALVDVLAEGVFSDSARSGYGQAEMIFATVATILHTFLLANPTETVYFQGSDPEGIGEMNLRQRLYNRILSKPDNYQLAVNYFRV